MQCIYNYAPATNHVTVVHSVATVLYSQFMLHVMLFRPSNIFCTFTSALPAVCVQCTIWLSFVIPEFRSFLVCCSDTVWVILKWFQSPLLLPVSLWHGSSCPCYYRYHFDMVPVAPVITGITLTWFQLLLLLPVPIFLSHSIWAEFL